MMEYDYNRIGLLFHIIEEANKHGQAYQAIAAAARKELDDLQAHPRSPQQRAAQSQQIFPEGAPKTVPSNPQKERKDPIEEPVRRI